MSSVKKSGGSDHSNLLKVPNGAAKSSGQDRALARLANVGKNDSVKSTYSLSVFLDPDASLDMVRHEELWYPMDDSTSITDDLGLTETNQDPRTATPSAAARSKKPLNRLTLTKEKEEQLTTSSNQMPNLRQKEELLRNGSRFPTSTTVASRSAHKGDLSGNESGTDMENHFNGNTHVLGVQSSGGGGGGAGGAVGGRAGGTGRGPGVVAGAREELGYGVRRWSTEKSLPKASEAQDTEDNEYGEEVAEQEEIGLTRSQIGAPFKPSPSGLGVSTFSDSAASEDVADYASRVEIGSDYRHVHDRADRAAEENDDRYLSGNHAGQGAARILNTSNLPTIEDADRYQAVTQGRQSSGKIRDVSNGSNSEANEAANYSSAMQPRMSSGQVRSRSQPTNFTDHGRSSDSVNRDASFMQMTQIRNAFEEEDSAVTEGSDKGMTGKSSHRESISTRAKFSRATAVDGSYQEIDHQMYPNGHTEVNSAHRNNSPVPSVVEMSDNYQGRRNGFGSGREGIRRTTPQSEAEAEKVHTPNSLTCREPNVRRTPQDVSSEDDTNNWKLPDGTISRQKDHNSSAYNNRRTTQEGSSDGEPEDLRRGARQATPVIRVTTPSSSSYTESRSNQKVTSDEDVGKMNAARNQPQVIPTPRLRGLASNGVGPASNGVGPASNGVGPASNGVGPASNGVPNAPITSQNLTSEEEEAVRGSCVHRTRPDQVSNSTRPGDVDQYRPHPAERKKLGAAGSLSSAGYPSPREPYAQNNYSPKAPNTRGRDSIDTDSVSASDDSRTPNNNIKGNAHTRRVYRERGYPTYAINSEVQPRSGILLNAADLSDGYSDSSMSNITRPRPQHRRIPTNQTMGYSDESDIEDDQNKRSQQQFFLHFQSESEDQEGTGYSKRKTTVTKKTTPVTGVVRVTPQPSSSEVVQKTITKTMKTTPVSGVVSIPDIEPRQRQADTSIERTRTPVVGLISVSRSPSPERTKTPVVRETTTKTMKTTPVTGVVSIPDAELRQYRTAAVIERNRTPVVGLISVSRSPSPERTKTPVVGVISVQQSHTVARTARSPQPVTGLISVSNNTQIQRRSTTPSAQLMPGVVNNSGAYPGKFHHQNRTDLASAVIETLAVPTPETQAEVVGVDPELKRAQKTRSNHYQITMNLRPVVGDSSSERGYEVYNTAVGRATPMSMDRFLVSGSRADWRNSEVDDRFYLRPHTATNGTLGSRHSSVGTLSTQPGFVSGRSSRVGSSISRLTSASSRGRIVNPRGKQAYIMGPGRPAGNFGAENLYLQDIPPRSYSVGTMDRSRSLSRQGPQYLGNTLLQVPPILQTVTSRPHRLSSDAELPGYDHGFPGERRRQQRCSSTMSSVFMSPTLDRRYNHAVHDASSFRDDSLYRYGRFT